MTLPYQFVLWACEILNKKPKADSVTLVRDVRGFPPRKLILSHRGRVNDQPMYGLPAGHVMFCGSRAERIPPGFLMRLWMRLRGKDIDSMPRWRVCLDFKYQSEPWNNLGTPGPVVDADGNPQYDPGKLDELLSL